jgi:hypothetical protein
VNASEAITPRDRVTQALLAHRFHFANEDQLKAGMAQVFNEAGIVFVREVVLGPKDRIDFLLPSGLGIEVKVKGSMTEVVMQLARYAEHQDVTSLILVTTKQQHATVPERLNGKRVTSIVLNGWV